MNLGESIKKILSEYGKSEKGNLPAMDFHDTKKIFLDDIDSYLKEFGIEDLSKPYFSMEGSETVVDFILMDGYNIYDVQESITKSMGGLVIENGENSLLLKKIGRGGKASYFFEIYRDEGDDVHLSFKKNGVLTSNEIEALVNAYKSCNFPLPALEVCAGECGASSQESTSANMSAEKYLESMGIAVYQPGSLPTWDYIEGYEKMKGDVIRNVINPLKNRDIYDSITRSTRKNYKSAVPRAVLFEGPPGTGKTVTAKIVAREANVPMVHMTVEKIISKWIGDSAKNMSNAIEKAEKIGGRPLIFFDEIDFLSNKRGGHSSEEETKRAMSVLLRKIEGVDAINDSLIVCATNRVGDLDAALLSRFGCVINFPLPNERERQQIYKCYAKHLPAEDLAKLARRSDHLAGRDIEKICEETERGWAHDLSEGIVKEPLPLFKAYMKNTETRMRNSPDLRHYA